MHIIVFVSAALLLQILSTLQSRTVMNLCSMQRSYQSPSVTLSFPEDADIGSVCTAVKVSLRALVMQAQNQGGREQLNFTLIKL